jgi:hypothetical protein
MTSLINTGKNALTETLADESRAAEMAAFETMIDALDDLFVGADEHPDQEFHLDDEPLHWCAIEVGSNLRAALFAAGAGFYSTALLAAERAVHLSVASLGYTSQESGLQVDGEAPLTPKFAEWEGGAPLPTAVELALWLRARQAARPPLPAGADTPEDRYRALVRELRAERYHHHFQRGYQAPGFHAEGYRVTLDALRDVLGTIAGLWLLELPHLRVRPLPTTLADCVRGTRLIGAGAE